MVYTPSPWHRSVCGAISAECFFLFCFSLHEIRSVASQIWAIQQVISAILRNRQKIKQPHRAPQTSRSSLRSAVLTWHVYVIFSCTFLQDGRGPSVFKFLLRPRVSAGACLWPSFEILQNVLRMDGRHLFLLVTRSFIGRYRGTDSRGKLLERWLWQRGA